MGMRLKIAAAALVVAGAGFAAYGWMRAGAEERVLEVIASGEIRARVRRCGCQGEKPAFDPKKGPLKITSCSCKKRTSQESVASVDLGALPERSAYQKAAGGHPLNVDVGDLFFPRAHAMGFERSEWLRAADLVLEAMERLGLDAFTPGELDLALGRGPLEALAKKAKFPFLAANLHDAKTHAPLFGTRARIERSGLRVGVLGIIAPPAGPELTALLEREGLELSDATAAARTEVAALRVEGCDVVLLLAHAPDALVRPIVKAVGGIDLVVHAHSEVPSESLSSFEHGAAFAVPWPGGGIMARFELRFTPGARAVTDYDSALEQRVWIERVKKQLEDQAREREHATPERAKELDEQIAFAGGKLREREAALPKEPLHEVTASGVILAASAWRQDQDPALLAAIERFKADLNGMGLDVETAKKLETPGVTAKGRPDAFAGAATCATCHKLQAENWAQTRHANAWASLEKSESQRDPSCVGCHSIGFRAPGGFAEPRRAEHDGRDYRNVQCESCHGARLSHTEDPRGAGVGVHFPTIESCRKCHDGEHDPSFDEKRFKKAFEGAPRICVKGLP